MTGEAVEPRLIHETDPAVPHAYWSEHDARLVHGFGSDHAVLGNFDWPYEGLHYHHKVSFGYYLFGDDTRGVIFAWGGGATPEQPHERLKILREARQIAARSFNHRRLQAIAVRKGLQAWQAATTNWIASLEADKVRVLAEIAAGRSAQPSRDHHCMARPRL